MCSYKSKSSLWNKEKDNQPKKIVVQVVIKSVAKIFTFKFGEYSKKVFLYSLKNANNY